MWRCNLDQLVLRGISMTKLVNRVMRNAANDAMKVQLAGYSIEQIFKHSQDPATVVLVGDPNKKGINTNKMTAKGLDVKKLTSEGAIALERNVTKNTLGINIDQLQLTLSGGIEHEKSKAAGLDTIKMLRNGYSPVQLVSGKLSSKIF